MAEVLDLGFSMPAASAACSYLKYGLLSSRQLGADNIKMV